MSKKIFQILLYVALGILILTCIPNIIYYNAVAEGPDNQNVDKPFASVMLWVNVAILAASTLAIVGLVVMSFLETRNKNKKSKKIGLEDEREFLFDEDAEMYAPRSEMEEAEEERRRSREFRKRETIRAENPTDEERKELNENANINGP